MNSRAFLIIQEPDLSAAITRYLTSWFPQLSIEKAYLPKRIFSGDVLDLHRTISDFIEEKSVLGGLRRGLALVGLPSLILASLDIESNPLSTSQQKQHPSLTLAAMLVLTFPEVRWLFLGATPDNEVEAIFKHHAFSADNLNEVLTSGADVVSLFDPSGLRNHIRANIKKGKETREHAKALPLRDKQCASIDDEEPYAFLHGYVGYKLGFGVRCSSN